MNNLGLGFLLMGVGMATVFAILLIVIYGSQGIIAIMNRIVKGEGGVSGKTRRVIAEAVREITAGKGTVKNITEIK